MCLAKALVRNVNLESLVLTGNSNIELHAIQTLDCISFSRGRPCDFNCRVFLTAENSTVESQKGDVAPLFGVGKKDQVQLSVSLFSDIKIYNYSIFHHCLLEQIAMIPAYSKWKDILIEAIQRSDDANASEEDLYMDLAWPIHASVRYPDVLAKIIPELEQEKDK
jgi:hypothetical protein